MSEALERIKLRNDFYKDNFRRIVFVLLLSLFINLVLMGVVLFMSTKQPEPVYFATTPEGQLFSVKSLDSPILENSAILSWVSRSVPQIYQLDPQNYRTDIARVEPLFTPLGWKQFTNQYAKVIENVTTNGVTVGAVLYDVPVVLRTGNFGGVDSWQVQVPLLISYQKDEKVQPQKVIMQLVLQKRKNTESNELLGIAQVLEKVVDAT